MHLLVLIKLFSILFDLDIVLLTPAERHLYCPPINIQMPYAHTQHTDVTKAFYTP